MLFIVSVIEAIDGRFALVEHGAGAECDVSVDCIQVCIRCQLSHHNEWSDIAGVPLLTLLSQKGHSAGGVYVLVSINQRRGFPLLERCVTTESCLWLWWNYGTEGMYHDFSLL